MRKTGLTVDAIIFEDICNISTNKHDQAEKQYYKTKIMDNKSDKRAQFAITKAHLFYSLVIFRHIYTHAVSDHLSLK